MLFRRYLLASIVPVGVFGDLSNALVNLGYIQVQGNTNFRSTFRTDIYAGIKYAHPPTGTLRWQAPVNIETNSPYPSGSVVSATTYAPSCIQGEAGWGYAAYKSQISPSMATQPSGQEDCLTLDVYVPNNATSSKLPVLVLIHGGGYVTGSSPGMSGFALTNASDGNVVIVSMQYRLGAFGFLASSQIVSSGTANAGLLDQRSALGWVQRHIAAFGGDPTKVTITGGSAGGGSVESQMLLYGGQANPPFRAVISEYPYVQSFKNSSVLEAQYQQLLSGTSCTTLACLRQVDSNTLALAAQKSYIIGYLAGLYNFGDFYYGPAIDGKTITDFPSKLFREGKFSKVPLMVDRDGDEGYAFSNQSQTTTADEITDFQYEWPAAKAGFFTKLFNLYPLSSFSSVFWQRLQIWGDYVVDCPTYYISSATTKAKLPTWKLIFSAGSGLHGATGAYIYGYQYSNANDQMIAGIMKDWWLSFTIALDPNAVSFSGYTKPNWPKYSLASGGDKNPAIAVTETNITVIEDLDTSSRCAFFQAHPNIVRS